MIIHTDWIIRNRDQTIAIVSEKAMKIYNIIENGSDDHIKDVSVDETVISDEHQKLNWYIKILHHSKSGVSWTLVMSFLFLAFRTRYFEDFK